MAIVKAEKVEVEIAQEADNAAAATLIDGSIRGLDVSWTKIRADSYTLQNECCGHAWISERVRKLNMELNDMSEKKAVVKNRIKALELGVYEKEYEKCLKTENWLKSSLTPVFEEEGTETMGYEIGIADLAQVVLDKEKLMKKIEKINGKSSSTSHVEEDSNVEELLKKEREKYNLLKSKMKALKHRVKAEEITLAVHMAKIESLRAKLPIQMAKFNDKHKWAVFVELADLSALSLFLQFIEQKKVGATHLIFRLGKSFRSLNVGNVLKKYCELSGGAFPSLDTEHLHKVSTTGDGTAHFSVLSDEEMTALGYKH